MLSDRYEKIKHFWLNKLNKELPEHLVYHSVEHTINVMNACWYLCEKEEVKPEEEEILLVAALFHDSGFLRQYKNNEIAGASIAREVLADFNYSTEEIDQVCDIILSTDINIYPKNKLENIIHDADLNYLGRPDYLSRASDLRKEMAIMGDSFEDKEWLLLQRDFLRSFSYVTASARSLVQEGLQKNLLMIEQLIDEFES